jgi:predicted DNA-binding protein (MmcQ/YjbR family)
MNLEDFRTYCLNLKGTSEGFPFDGNTLVFKVQGKMFALTDVEQFGSVNLKCDPERAIELREEYADIQPGYHMSKKHWNTVQVNGDVDGALLYELIDHSYQLVVASLPKKLRDELQG